MIPNHGMQLKVNDTHVKFLSIMKQGAQLGISALIYKALEELMSFSTPTDMFLLITYFESELASQREIQTFAEGLEYYLIENRGLEKIEKLIELLKDVNKSKGINKQECIAQLKQGADVWHKWLKDHGFSSYHDEKMKKIDLSGADLSGLDLTGVRLCYVNLSGANLSGTTLFRADFKEANLNCANLSNANLFFAFFHKANLDEANLSNANLRGARFNNASLREANLSFALCGRGEYNSSTHGYHLETTEFDFTNFTGAILNGVEINDMYLIGARFDYADLKEAKLRNVDTASSHFPVTDFSKSHISKTHINNNVHNINLNDLKIEPGCFVSSGTDYPLLTFDLLRLRRRIIMKNTYILINGMSCLKNINEIIIKNPSSSDIPTHGFVLIKGLTEEEKQQASKFYQPLFEQVFSEMQGMIVQVHLNYHGKLKVYNVPYYKDKEISHISDEQIKALLNN